MTGAGSVGGGDRLRLFLALRVPDDVLDAVSAWQRERLAHAAGVRIVPREHLHVTLAFLGSRPMAELDPILGVLRAAAARVGDEIRFAPQRYRETRSVGMLVLEDEAGRAGALAVDVQAGLERLGVHRRERRLWLPHLTVVRFREPPRLHPEPPPLRTFVPSDAAAYLSRLRPGGAEYEVLESVELGSSGTRARVGGE